VNDWLDMTQYPNLDPNDAVSGAVLSELRDVLLGHELTPLPDGLWHQALAGATGTGETVDNAGGGWDSPGSGNQGSWWLEHQPEGSASHHLPPDPHHMSDPHVDGGHW
jgi:hypothetical protein